jgi:hydrogenase maturation protein HypF
MNEKPRESAERQRVRVAITGAVQGVGFRPFVYRLATSLRLTGWVGNSSHGVLIEAEGDEASLQQFLLRLSRERPPRSFIQSLEPTMLDPVGFERFDIRPSLDAGTPSALVVPDIALCDECLRELFDPADRRYRYPFINCTNCGPRFSIVEALPYDRPNTTMKAFAMCEECRREYEDPGNRRFHAQPNACPRCGPQLALWNPAAQVLVVRDAALRSAADAIRGGQIVAIKGLGGFHLVVDARNEAAVARLRARKVREEKPLALMYPAIDGVRADCEVSPLEERLLLSPEAPIVLLRRRGGRVGRVGRASVGTGLQPGTRTGDGYDVTDAVAPGTPEFGVMLPYTPLHHLLLRELGFPIVATSGNLSDEPICTDEREAVERLAGIADLFLVHDRPIARHVDDSVARVVLGRELVLRRARGYAPLPVRLAHDHPPVLAVGAHLKNTIAASVGSQVFVSQHIGDLETEQAFKAFRQVIGDFGRLYAFTPSIVACDAHPNYLSTWYARELAVPVVAIQHHEAHVLACMAENELTPPVLGVSWDGTGFGLDGTIWGGEFLLVTDQGCDRRAALRSFPLPGGEQAIKEPRRSALGLLFEAFGREALAWTHLPPVAAFAETDLKVLESLLIRAVNAPRTSSAGRLFDAVASLAGLHQRVRFEGQAAMALQFAADEAVEDEAYEIPISAGQGSSPAGPPFQILDWAPMLREILDDIEHAAPAARISARFHNALANAIVAVATRVGHEQVALTGGCFQNALLLERAVRRLRSAGFRPYWHQRIPPNDGGIALGQVVGAIRQSMVI